MEERLARIERCLCVIAICFDWRMMPVRLPHLEASSDPSDMQKQWSRDIEQMAAQCGYELPR